MKKWFAKSTPSKQTTLSDIHHIHLAETSIEIDSSQLTTQLKMIDLSEEDIRTIRMIQPLIIEHIDELLILFTPQ